MFKQPPPPPRRRYATAIKVALAALAVGYACVVVGMVLSGR